MRLLFLILFSFRFSSSAVLEKNCDETRSKPGGLIIQSPILTVQEHQVHDDKIIGGVPAEINEFPYIVSIQTRKYAGSKYEFTQYCDGTILNKEWILTAGHCCGKPGITTYSILAGAHDHKNFTGNEQRVNVFKVVRNKMFNGDTIDYDVGLMQVYPYFEFTKSVQPVQLAFSNSVPEGKAQAAGWGITSNEAKETPNILQKVSLSIILQEDCIKIYKDINQITSRMFCAGFTANKCVSHGDSGGPLMCSTPDGRKYQCGIVSWGVGCAYEGFPGVFTRVSSFADWIQCKISANIFCDQRIVS